MCKHAGKNTIIIAQFLKHVFEGNIEGTGKEEDVEEDVSSYWRNQRILETERGSARSHSVENSLWNRIPNCRKANYGMNE